MSDPLILQRVIQLLETNQTMSTTEIVRALSRQGYFGTVGRVVRTLRSCDRLERDRRGRWRRGAMPPHDGALMGATVGARRARTGNGAYGLVRCSHTGRCSCSQRCGHRTDCDCDGDRAR